VQALKRQGFTERQAVAMEAEWIDAKSGGTADDVLRADFATTPGFMLTFDSAGEFAKPSDLKSAISATTLGGAALQPIPAAFGLQGDDLFASP
jgi:hypothetical protein